MKIDLKELYNKKYLLIDNKISFDSLEYQNSTIKSLKDLNVKGTIQYNAANELDLDLILSGIMVIEDAYSLELVDFPFNISIKESYTEEELDLSKNSQKNEKILDITDILWQNIVLEVPISYSKKKEAAVTKGEGWELLKENEKKTDSRLAKLKELLEEGKE